MVGCGEKEREAIRPEFDRSIMIDIHGAKITSDTGFLLLRERYAQTKDKEYLFIIVTTVLFGFARMAHPPDTLLGSADLSRRPRGRENWRNGKSTS